MASIVCEICGKEKALREFPAARNWLVVGGRCKICMECLEKEVEKSKNKLKTVDEIMRFLNRPFDPNLWMRVEKEFGGRALRAYFDRLRVDGEYDGYGWEEENAKWMELRNSGEEEEELEFEKEQRVKGLVKRWGSDYSLEEMEWLEDYYKRILATQNVNTPILEEQARDLCELELQIKNGLRRGEDIKKFMDARNDIIKIANFTASSSKTAAAFESVGELMMYYGKKGFKPNYHQEPKDSIDFLMDNAQSYLKRLVMNEGSLEDMVEEKRAAVELSQHAEEMDLTTNFNLDGVSRLEYEDGDIGLDDEVSTVRVKLR